MTKKKLLKLSLITLIIGLCVLAIAYFFFHFVTDDGITFTWHPALRPGVLHRLWTALSPPSDRGITGNSMKPIRNRFYCWQRRYRA